MQGRRISHNGCTRNPSSLEPNGDSYWIEHGTGGTRRPDWSRMGSRTGAKLNGLPAPVEPGNLLLLGYRQACALVSAPGCFRSAKPNVLRLSPSSDTRELSPIKLGNCRAWRWWSLDLSCFTALRTLPAAASISATRMVRKEYRQIPSASKIVPQGSAFNKAGF